MSTTALRKLHEAALRRPLSPEPDQRLCELEERYIEEHAADVACELSDAGDSDTKLLAAARKIQTRMQDWARANLTPRHLR